MAKKGREEKGKEEKTNITRRRLLLAKELYQHGLEHSRMPGGLNHMIAVHNLHNAIEMVLRAIVLEYNIRPDKDVNFPSMLDEIDSYSKKKSLKLPYRSQMTVLNQTRNRIQHHAAGVTPDEVDHSRFFAKAFLVEVCNSYFRMDFDGLARTDWIKDDLLKEVLLLSQQYLNERQNLKSILLSKIAFLWAEHSLKELLPGPDASQRTFLSMALKEEKNEAYKDLTYQFAIRTLAEMVEDSMNFSALLSTGVTLGHYKKFLAYTPEVTVAGSYPSWHGGPPPERDQQSQAKWVHDFAVGTIISWQDMGLEPHVIYELQEVARRILDEGDDSWKKFLEPPNYGQRYQDAATEFEQPDDPT